MHRFLLQYLKQQGSCVLPTLGKLSFEKGSAALEIAQHQLSAGKQNIVFDFDESLSDDSFVHYVQSCTKAPLKLSHGKVMEFVAQIKNNASVSLPGVGAFENDGKVVKFVAALLPEYFEAVVPAKKIVHQNVAHSMIVGDKETTTTEMAEYYNETPVVADKWWIWALLLAIVAIATILIYYFAPSLM